MVNNEYIWTLNPDTDIKGNKDLEEIYYTDLQFNTLEIKDFSNLMIRKIVSRAFPIGIDERDDSILIVQHPFGDPLEATNFVKYGTPKHLEAVLNDKAYKVSRATYAQLVKDLKVRGDTKRKLPVVIDATGNPVAGCFGGYDNLVLCVLPSGDNRTKSATLVCINNTGRLFYYTFKLSNIDKNIKQDDLYNAITNDAIRDAIEFKNWGVYNDNSPKFNDYSYHCTCIQLAVSAGCPMSSIKGIKTFRSIITNSKIDIKKLAEFLTSLAPISIYRFGSISTDYLPMEVTDLIYNDKLLFARMFILSIEQKKGEAPILAINDYFRLKDCVYVNLAACSSYNIELVAQLTDYSFDAKSNSFLMEFKLPGSLGEQGCSFNLIIDLQKMVSGAIGSVSCSKLTMLTDEESASVFTPFVDDFAWSVFYNSNLDLSPIEVDIEKKDEEDEGGVEQKGNVTQVGSMTLESVIGDLEAKGFKRQKASLVSDIAYFNTHLSAWLNENDFVSLSKASINGKVSYKVDTYRNGEFYASIEGNFNEEAFANYFAYKNDTPTEKTNLRTVAPKVVSYSLNQKDSEEYNGKISLNKYQKMAYEENPNFIAYPEAFFAFNYAKEYSTGVRKENNNRLRYNVDYYALADFKPTGEACIVLNYISSNLHRKNQKLNTAEIRFSLGAPKILILMRFKDSQEAIKVFNKLKKDKLMTTCNIPNELIVKNQVPPDILAKNYAIDDTENLAFIALRTMLNADEYTQDILEAQLNL